MPPASRSGFVVLRRALLTCALIVGLYYLLPVEPGITGTRLVVRVLSTVVVGILVTWLILLEIRERLVSPEHGSLGTLLVTLVGGVVFFALADYETAVLGKEQFADLTTKTDALYFALTTLSTVGYGDVHPVGQLARGLVTIQVLFNLVILATGVSVLTRELRVRARKRFPTD